MNEKWAPMMILVAAVLWGTTGTAQSFAPDEAHPIAIGAVRLAVGGWSLFLLMVFLGKFSMKNWPVKETVGAAFCMACYQPFFFSAVLETGVAVGTVITIGSAPILSGVIEWLILKKRPVKVWWYSTILSIAGCVLLFSHQQETVVNPAGVVMALIAGLSFACYTIISRRLGDAHSSLSVVAMVFSVSAIFLSPFLFLYDLSWLGDPRGIGISVHLGLVTTGLAYFLFAIGLRYVKSSTAVTLTLGEPLTAAMLGVFIVGERLSEWSWVGVFLLFIGIGLLMLSTLNRKFQRIPELSVVKGSEYEKSPYHLYGDFFCARMPLIKVKADEG